MKKLYLLFLFFTSLIYAQDPFIFTWEVTNPNIPLHPPVVGIDNNFTVDFGDGVILTNQVQSLGHNYDAPGIYTVSISGDFHRVKFENSWDKLLTIEQWGDTQWSSMEDAFKNCENLVINATDTPNLSQVSSMKGMFSYCTAFNSPLNNWDVSNVTDMSRMFYEAESFNQPLNNWNTSNVTTMSEMFSLATSFNQLLESWNVSNVTNMGSMFEGATSFNQPLNSWDVSNVTITYEMFRNADSFNQPLNNWNVSNVTDMASMFEECDNFNQPIGNWNVSNVELMEYMFYDNPIFNQPLNNWNVSSATNMRGMFAHSVFNQPIDNWNVSGVTDMHVMFWGNTIFDQPLNNWDVTNVTDMGGMFWGASSFNQSLNNWNISNVIEMGQMFANAIGFNQDLSSWSFNTNVNLQVWTSDGDFLSNSGLDTTNYDSLLLKFAQLGLQNKVLGAQGLFYCNTGVRNHLINNLGWTITGDSLGADCIGNNISGTVLLDEDANGCDANDVTAVNFLVNAADSSFNYSTLPSADGAYNLNVQEGVYTLNLLNVPGYYTVSPATSSINFTGFGNAEELNFCLTANQTIEDLNVTVLPLNEARPGFESNYQLVVKNMGTQTVANASVSLTFDDALQAYITAAPAPTATTVNQLTFAITDLQPFESNVIDLTMQTYTPPTVNGGETTIFTAVVTPDANDFTPVDNTFELAQVVVNSYDPNDKRVLQGEEIFIEQADEYLDYIIRFQNTGSASAITVRIEDELHQKLDWTTLTPVSASHGYRVEVTDGNHVEFIFDDINLPHQAANDAGSNGFIAYKIKPVEGIEIGDIFSGNASIYFDYNLPIITNTVSTEVVTSLSVNEFEAGGTVTVYPNPVNSILHLKAADAVNIEQANIINFQGRELLSVKANAETINVESLNSGVYLLVIKTNKGNITHKLVKN